MNWTPQQARDYMTRRLRDESRARERMQHEASSDLGAVSHTEHKHVALETLERQTPRSDQGASSVGDHSPILRVQIISVRAKRTDSDNLAAKWLRDAISASLGFDDGDSHVEWETDQVRTEGEEGVIVRLELI